MIIQCKNCGKDKKVRKADAKRGWGKFCSKVCKAKDQERRTGQYLAFLERQDDYLGDLSDEQGTFAHKNTRL